MENKNKNKLMFARKNCSFCLNFSDLQTTEEVAAHTHTPMISQI